MAAATAGQGEKKINWKALKPQKKAELKKWKEMKLLKKLEKQRVQEEMAQKAVEEEASAADEKEELKQFKEAKCLKNQEKKKAREEMGTKRVETNTSGDKGCPYTLSIALPGSILDNAQSPELRAYLVGQIARACTVFSADEIVVFDELGENAKSLEGEFTGIWKKGESCVQMARMLQYLECPQYLRKYFFPMHKDLYFAGLLNPLDSPTHLRIDEESEYREGVVMDRPCKLGSGSFVNCGMRKEVQIDRQLQPGLRVTVQLDKNQVPGCKVLQGKVVSPQQPRTKAGLHWGYRVRLASSLSAVFSECPFKEGYDLSIGTSERGSSVDDVVLPAFRHALIVFGGLHGLEASVDSDEHLQVADPSVLFDLYLNTCPGQGSRTIRTEEAVLVSLSALRPKIEASIQSPLVK